MQPIITMRPTVFVPSGTPFDVLVKIADAVAKAPRQTEQGNEEKIAA